MTSIRIGSRIHTTAEIGYGYLDNLRIWTKALTYVCKYILINWIIYSIKLEILNDYNGIVPSGPIADFDMKTNLGLLVDKQ